MTAMYEVAPPRISRRRAVVTAVAGLTVSGALVGALWAWLAPSIHGVVALTKRGERVKAYLGNESDHFFVAAFLIVGMLGALAVVAAVLLWQWRAHRGPVMVAALAIGAGAAAGAAAGVGAVLVHWRYGAIDIAGAPVSPEHRVHYVVEAPAVFFGHSPLQIAATILLPAATAALVYALMAVSTARDDLGAWPPVEEPPASDPPVTAESALPSAQ
jgi:MFS family permease